MIVYEDNLSWILDEDETRRMMLEFVFDDDRSISAMSPVSQYGRGGKRYNNRE